MNLHEYQAKNILAGHGITTPKGVVIDAQEQVRDAVATLDGERWVVKAQVHAGGRGKAGGVRLCAGLAEVETAVADLLGKPLRTHQTGSHARMVRGLLIEETVEIQSEMYMACLVDRKHACIALMVSPDGGMDIETVAVETPDRIRIFDFFDQNAEKSKKIDEICSFLGLKASYKDVLGSVVHSLIDAFQACDATMIEMNPLVLTGDGRLVALDAKLSLDDNARYRHAEWEALRDIAQEDPLELEAASHGLNYIALDGNIGCMVNGAGLAMASMDIIQLKGGSPANFLDVGGGVSRESVAEGFHLLFSNGALDAVMVNIFGGIVRCDMIAQGLLDALEGHVLRVPLVMRLVGTNEEEGRAIVAESGIRVHWAKSLDDAAETAVRLSGESAGVGA